MLKTRAISAAIMAPPALAATWAGGYAFAVLAAAAAGLMVWEWHRMVAGGFGLPGRLSAAGCLLAALLAVAWPQAAVAVVLVAAAVSAILPAAVPSGRSWSGFGALYVGLPAVSLVWLRQEPQGGGLLIFWVFLMVWATDIGAYASGRLIGGPLLLPSVSPRKTWAGLIGGMASAGLAGWAVGRWGGLPDPIGLGLISAAGAVVAQVGDFFESWVKRRAGVKDSSGIIPGHGGVLDRVDGLLTVALVVAAATLVGGRPLLAW